MWKTIKATIAVLASAALIASCGGSKPPAAASGNASPAPAAGDKVVNLYIWSDYLADDTLANFTKQTGIKVNVAYYDSNEILETKLLSGHSGFDVVVPTVSYMERQIKAGVYLPLDKSKLPNLKNMDPQLMSRVAQHDPGNGHSVIYMWGTNGIGYNEKMIKALLPDAPLDSWRLIFDTSVISKVAKCGVTVLDSPAEMMRATLNYLGKDPNSQNEADMKLAAAALMKIRPYIRNINSAEYIESLANGDICIAVGYNGDVMQARDRAKEAGKGVEVKYVIPKEGTIMWFDMLGIPKDAPNPDSGHAFINYIMQPEVTAAISNFKKYANANVPATALVSKDVTSDPGIYPPEDMRKKLFVQLADTPEHTREITRIWTKFKTGQ